MFSIIIASYHRPQLLYQCCVSLAAQEGIEEVEIIIVDNASNGGLEELAQVFPDFRFVKEPKQGLSLARNRGIDAASKAWLLFLDDDVLLPKGFLQQAFGIAQTGDYAVFGGHYSPWYPSGRPDWLPNDFGEKHHLRADRGPIVPGIDGFLSGGVLAVKKAALDQVGAFATDLGMGAKMAYGEEDELQLRLHRAGFTIGYDPHWSLQHAVLPHKLKVSWHLRSAYARRRDAQRIPYGFGQLLLLTLRTLTGAFFKLPGKLWQLVSKKDYYWQNMVLELLIPIARRAGDWVAFRRS